MGRLYHCLWKVISDQGKTLTPSPSPWKGEERLLGCSGDKERRDYGSGESGD